MAGILVVGAASSRDHLSSRLEAAPTGIFYGNFDFTDKHFIKCRLQSNCTPDQCRQTSHGLANV
jgi:hypothetical protein